MKLKLLYETETLNLSPDSPTIQLNYSDKGTAPFSPGMTGISGAEGTKGTLSFFTPYLKAMWKHKDDLATLKAIVRDLSDVHNVGEGHALLAHAVQQKIIDFRTMKALTQDLSQYDSRRVRKMEDLPGYEDEYDWSQEAPAYYRRHQSERYPTTWKD